MAVVQVVVFAGLRGGGQKIVVLPPAPPSRTVDVTVRRSNGTNVVFRVARAR